MIDWTYLFIYLINFILLIFITTRGFKSIDNERKIPYLWAIFFGFISFIFSLLVIILKISNYLPEKLYLFLDGGSFASTLVMTYFWFIYTDYLQGKKLVKHKIKVLFMTIPLIIIELLIIVFLICINIKGFNLPDWIPSEKYTILQLSVIYSYVGIASLRALIMMFKKKIFRERYEHLTIASYGLYPLLFGLIQIIISGYDLISTGVVLAMLQAYFYVNSLEKERDSNYSKLITFSKLFLVIYFIDVTNNKCERLSEETYYEYQKFSKKGYEKRIKPYDLSCGKYIENYVHPEDKLMMLKMTSDEYMKDNLSPSSPFYSCIYRQIFNGVCKWYRMYMILQSADETGVTKNTVLAVMDVDNDVNKDIKQRTLVEEALLEAQRANNAKSSFLSNMSHDIRTPMNAIMGYTTLANMYIDDKERVSDCLNKIMTSSNHLLDLINNVLDMSRIESGKTVIEEKECDLDSIIQSIMKIIQNHLSSKNIQFNLDTSKVKTFTIISDKLRISQIIMNLVSNAIKYTPSDGKVSLIVSENKIDNTKSNYEFIIEDNGIGMDKEFLSCIFDPFEREKTTTESGIEGTGLGLAIVKKIIDLMGGTIKVESTAGIGTKFIVNLQLKHTVTQEDNQSSPGIHNFKNIRLLIVEDNDLNYEIIYEILTDLGFMIERAFNGLESYDIVNNSIPGYFDLVLMDIQMPVMNGYDATKKIRQIEDEKLKNIPIIAMTANAFNEDIAIAKEAGMNAHVSKPIEFDKLINTICNVLDID